MNSGGSKSLPPSCKLAFAVRQTIEGRKCGLFQLFFANRLPPPSSPSHLLPPSPKIKVCTPSFVSAVDGGSEGRREEKLESQVLLHGELSRTTATDRARIGGPRAGAGAVQHRQLRDDARFMHPSFGLACPALFAAAALASNSSGRFWICTERDEKKIQDMQCKAKFVF